MEVRGKEEDAQRSVSKLRQENKALREPMQSMQHRVYTLEQQLQHYTRDKAALMVYFFHLNLPDTCGFAKSF